VNPKRWLTLVVLLCPLLLSAHQQKEAVTRVLFNPRTANIEVMHRFLLHDAEHAVRKLLDSEADILGSEATRQAFAAYVYERFSIADQDGNVIALSGVGKEIDGRFIWVYQEAPISEGISALRIRHGALRDLWPEQVNLVNVERNGNLASARFQGSSDEITLDIQE
jgi:hypothetical protein